MEYGLPVFTREVDALVHEVYELGGLRDEYSYNYLSHVSADVHRLRRQGSEVEEPESVRQFKEWLIEERDRLY
jgi:hypothetical protein